MKYWTGAHTKHRLKFHLVWIVKYRRRVIQGKISKRIKELLYQCCEVNNWWIGKISIGKEHIHIIIQINPADSLASVAQKLKGGSSKKLREEYPELEEFLWGDSFWADGYFAETFGQCNEAVIKAYVRNQ